MDNHEIWIGLHRPIVEKLDTATPGWFDEGWVALLDGDSIEVFDWRPKGASKRILVCCGDLNPRRGFPPQLQKILRAEGVSLAAIRRGRG